MDARYATSEEDEGGPATRQRGHKEDAPGQVGSGRTDAEEPPVDFSGLLLSARVVRGLTEAGYLRPSPIQLRAIPLARCGVDVIGQAQSGTGKTCVFGVVAVEAVTPSQPGLQALLLAPTREIALQTLAVIREIGRYVEGLRCEAFVGGTPHALDPPRLRAAHIAVATPGRALALLDESIAQGVRIVVLDEADKLLDTNLREQTLSILQLLPQSKQVLAFSATYRTDMLEVLNGLMRNPQHVILSADTLAVREIQQYYSVVSSQGTPFMIFNRKAQTLMSIFERQPFQQALVFTNDKSRGQQLADQLSDRGWPAAFLAGVQMQHVRARTMSMFRDLQLRILVSTDLVARGVDVERVNLVINLDVPYDAETYLHRIGRTGRFGAQGVAITLVTDKEERELLALAAATGCAPALLPPEMGGQAAARSRQTQALSLQASAHQSARQAPSSHAKAAPPRDDAPRPTSTQRSNIRNPDEEEGYSSEEEEEEEDEEEEEEVDDQTDRADESDYEQEEEDKHERDEDDEDDDEEETAAGTDWYGIYHHPMGDHLHPPVHPYEAYAYPFSSSSYPSMPPHPPLHHPPPLSYCTYPPPPPHQCFHSAACCCCCCCCSGWRSSSSCCCCCPAVPSTTGWWPQ